MSKFEGNAITWFEIPTADIARARGFYEQLLDTKMIDYSSDEPCFIFPSDNGIGGCLVSRSEQKPAADGTLIYLNVDGKLDTVLGRTQTLGSKVLVPRTEIPGGFGFYACVTDSEGNHVGLHSR
jgi:uncharacterized protein